MDIIIKPDEQQQLQNVIAKSIDEAAQAEAEAGGMPDIDPSTGEYIIDQPDKTKPMTLRQLRSLAFCQGIHGVEVEETLDDGVVSFHFFRKESKEPHVSHFRLDTLPCERDALEAFRVLCQQVRAEKP